MAWADDKGKIGQDWVWYVEIRPRTCDEVYGTAPCTASGGQCAYSWATCEDVDNFNLTTRTFKFSSKNGKHIFKGENIQPTLNSVSDIPTEIDPKKSVTINARVQLMFEDVKNPPPIDSDKGGGKFYDYTSSGATFWRIFLRIYRESYKYCSLKLYEGLASYTSLSDFSLRRELKINNIEIMSNGKVRVTATDKTRTTKTIKIPNAISSTNVLTSDMNNHQTTIPVTDGDEFKLLSGGYPSYGKIIDEESYGDEYFKFTGISGNTLTGVTRGLFGTIANPHMTGNKVIQVAAFANDADTGSVNDTGENPVDICKEIILGWVGIDSGDVDSTEFNAERDQWYPSLAYRRIIESPINADKLLSQLNQFMMSNIWQDENQKLTFKGLVPVAPGEARTEFKTSENILIDSITRDNKTETQVSRVILHFAPNDTWGTKDHTDEDDFSEHLIWINAAAENNNGQGDPIEIEFFADWIYDDSEAKAFTARYIRRFAPTAPAEIRFTVYRRNADTYTGDVIDFTTGFFVDDDGSDRTVNVQILSKKESQKGIIKMKALETKFYLKYAFISPAGYPDWTSATDAQKEYGYICDTSTEEMSDGDGASYIW